MKKLYIIKTGTTFSKTRQQLGDFDQWTVDRLAPLEIGLEVINAEQGEILPDPENCAGVVVTGSHTMVTDNLPWSVTLEKWLAQLLNSSTPILGICYGHQLLAQAGGGEVGYHPKGKEVGTVRVGLLPDASTDPIFEGIPSSFPIHTTHSQSVLTLPPSAIRIAANTHEPNHAYRLGKCAWGVQFHPEYTTDIMHAYIREQAHDLLLDGVDVSKLLHAVVETPVAAQILKNFACYVRDHMRSNISVKD
jgi:GMP synthase (glutamine-hydrolysing)